MTDMIELRICVSGEETVKVDRAVYEKAKNEAITGQALGWIIASIGTDATVEEPDGTVVDVETGVIWPPLEPVYLVWSNIEGAWWGPDGRSYRHDVWAAGRYSEAEATKACGMRTWANGQPPPEVMVLAPEHGRGPFVAGEIARVSEQMGKLVDIESRARIAGRAAPRVGA